MCEMNKHARHQYKLSSYYHDEFHIHFNKLFKIKILIIKKCCIIPITYAVHMGLHFQRQQ